MERKYKAFISYRHLPLQMEVAKAVHRRIEHYTVPKNLRKDGARKVGLVFRDQDELPIAGSLSANIQTALDNSEFLIVICTPETSGSEWVLREISYFLEHHDHDHVLAVLADGAPEEAFPKQITEIRGEDGELLEIVEPLAANIVAPTKAKRRRLFQTESLRILAALIGCPYDALYRREQRYRFRRLAIASGTIFSLAAAFVGLLLNRNAKIEEQLRASQINESRALAALGYNSFKSGNYREALSSVLKALPSEENERPYVADAEYTLSRELQVYGRGGLHFDQSIEQPVSVSNMLMSKDSRYLVTLDAYSMIRAYDTYSGKELWERQCGRNYDFAYIDELQAVFAGGELYDAATGEQLWKLESAYSASAFSRNGAFMVYTVYSNGKDYLCVADAKTGKVLCSTALEGSLFIMTGSAVSDDGKWAAVCSASSGETYGRLQLYDVQNNELLMLDDQLSHSPGIVRELMFLDDGSLMTAFAGTSAENGGVAVYDREKNWERRFDTALRLDQSSVYMNGKLILGGSIDFLDYSADMIVYGSLKNLYLIDRETGEITMDLLLPDVLSCGILNDNNSFGLILENGLITGGISSGILTSDAGLFYKDMDYSLSKGAIGGESYRKGVFAIVNNEYKTTISILRWQSGEEMTPVASEGTEMDLKKARIYASPSGKLMAALSYDHSEMILSCMLWRESDPKPRVCTVQCEKAFTFDSGTIFLTEDGKLIAEDYVYDLESGTVSGLTPSGKTANELELYSIQHSSASAADRESGSVLTAALLHTDSSELPQLSIWKDAEMQKLLTFPKELYSPELRYKLCAAGINGWVVLAASGTEGKEPETASAAYAYLTDEDRFVALTHIEREYAEVCTLAEDSGILAAVGENGSILLVNIPDDTVTKTIETAIPSSSIKKMLFVKNDTKLLVMSDSGDLLIYDVQTGEQLNRAYFGDRNFSFHADANCSAVFSQDGRQLLLIVNDDTYTESVIICLETEKWNCVGMHISAAHYLPDTDRVIINPTQDEVYYAPFYSREDLMAKAKAVLEREALRP